MKSTGLHEGGLHRRGFRRPRRDLAYIAANYPTAYDPFLMRLRSVIARIRMWPDSAREVDEQPGVRVVPLLRYPYNLFYRNTGEAIEILYIHHAAQDER